MPVKQLFKDQDRKFRLLFEEHPQPMWVFDAEGQCFLEANQPAAELYGYRSEEHTSELQSQFHLVCRHLLEKKKPQRQTSRIRLITDAQTRSLQKSTHR